MKRFVKRFQDRIVGIVAGPDRLLFRATLRSISYTKSLEKYLSVCHILHKDFHTFAQGATQQIREHAERFAQKHGRPFLYLKSPRTSKEAYAQCLRQDDDIQQGLICVLGCVEPCQTFRTRKNRETGKLELQPRRSRCLHLYFYFVDREFGLMHIRLQTWLPFTIQVCLNGREWLAVQMRRRGIGHQQRDNCFPRIDQGERAQVLLDSLNTRNWVNRLKLWASWVNPWLKSEPSKKLWGYYWSVRESEYATDLLFRDAGSLGEIYPALVRHALEQFDCANILRFLGKRLPARCRSQVRTHLARGPEGIRVKHWVEENSIKMYDKQGSVLRIETTINNPRRCKVRRRNGQGRMAWLPLRKGVVDFRRRMQICRAANERYLNALAVVGEASPAHRLLDPVSQSLTCNGRRYRGLRPIGPEDGERLRLLHNEKFLLHGFRNRDLQACWTATEPDQAPEKRRLAPRVSRWLAILRAHGVIYRLRATQCYRITNKGHSIITAACRLRHAQIGSLVQKKRC